jgi:hypothetical protein
VSERINHSTQFNEHQTYTNSSCVLIAHLPIWSNNLLNDVSRNTLSISTEKAFQRQPCWEIEDSSNTIDCKNIGLHCPLHW